MQVALEKVTVHYGPRAALDSVTLEVPQGTRLGITGGPGSGKTTLLKALAGLRHPSSGRVLWDGRDVWSMDEGERRARQAAFGMVFQTDALFDSSTVLENVVLPLVRRGVDPEEADRLAREAVDAVGLSDSADLLPDALSGGMRKRAGIARAVAARPQVLLADDPFAGLDPSTATQVASLLDRASEGRTLIVAMPDPTRYLALENWLALDAGVVVSSQ